MRRTTITGLSAIGVALTLVAGVSAVSYAANGGTMLIGKLNTGTTKTIMQNTAGGSALGLNISDPTKPPLTTNGKGKVANLYADRAANADELGGSTKAEVLAAARTVRGLTFTDTLPVRGGNTNYDLPAIPAGVYLVTVGASVRLNTPTDWTASPVDVNEFKCLVYNTNSLNRPLSASSTNFDASASGIASVHASIILDVTGNESWRMTCQTTKGNGWSTVALVFPLERPQVSFIKLQGNTRSSVG